MGDNEDDERLWAAVTKDVEPIEKEKDLPDPEGGALAPGSGYGGRSGSRVVSDSPHKPPRTRHMARADSASFQHRLPPVPPPHSKPATSDIDARTLQKLQRGQISIDGRLDLHGFNQVEAQLRLADFIKNAYARGLRCLLVITGKGRLILDEDDFTGNAPGVIKRKTPEWLKDSAIGHMVLRAVPAQPRDGGAGALYIYLRRKRD